MGETNRNRLPASVYWRRRAIRAIGAAGVGAALVCFGPDVVDNISQRDGPVPAGCEAYLRPGQSYWDLAQQIDDRVGQDTAQVALMLSRANPEKSVGELEPGAVSVPAEYCSIVTVPGFNE